MRLDKLRKEMKFLNWGSDRFLFLKKKKRPEPIRKVWKFASIPDQWETRGSFTWKLWQDLGPFRHQRRSVAVQGK